MSVLPARVWAPDGQGKMPFSFFMCLSASTHAGTNPVTWPLVGPQMFSQWVFCSYEISQCCRHTEVVGQGGGDGEKAGLLFGAGEQDTASRVTLQGAG